MIRLRNTTMPFLVAVVLALPACFGDPYASDRTYDDGWNQNHLSAWRHGFVRDASWRGGGRYGDLAAHGGGSDGQDPAGNLVLLAPPPFTAVYPTSLDQAYGTLERYYEAHASERAGQCLAPYIDGITNSQVIENTPSRLVVDVRYLYRDRLKTEAPTSCIGYGARRFVLARNSHGLDVTEMSGPRRN